MVRRERAYKVGYRRPPRRAQFRPGQSRNPRGRPTGSRNFASVMKKVLAKPIKVTQNGTEKRMSTQEAFANLLATRALGGEAKAMSLLIRLVDLVDSDPNESNAQEPSVRPEDELVMASIIKRIRSIEDADSAASMPGAPLQTSRLERPTED